jgi:predicted PurR-regulated permease PerM
VSGVDEQDPAPVEETPAADETAEVPEVDPAEDLAETGSFPTAAMTFFTGLPRWTVGVAGVAVLALLAVGLGLLYIGLGDFLIVLFLSLITAYLLDPLIDRFEASGWNRGIAILVCLGLFLSAVGVTALLIIPYVVNEIGQLTGRLDQYADQTAAWVLVLQTRIEELTGIENLGLSDLVRRIPELAKGVPTDALDPVKGVVGWAFGSTVQMLGLIVQWSLFPIFVFFFLRDFDSIKSFAFELLPFRARRIVLDHYIEIDGKIAAFIRGQVLVAGVLAVLYSLGLLIFTDIDLALLIGVMAGVLFVVPYLGTILGVALGTLMALLKFGLSLQIIWVWLVFAVVQLFEGSFLTPKIVGDSVGLHPVAVMVSLLVGASLFGILGMLLAVPVTASLAVVGTTALAWYKRTEWFQQGREDAPSGDDLP